jgi:hypothetical protein
MIKSTKAKTLDFLAKSDISHHLLPQKIIFQDDFKEQSNYSRIVDEITSWGCDSFVIRSSSAQEDQDFSNAGKFKSFLDVKLDEIASKADEVFDSYGTLEKNKHCFIQPYIHNSKSSGVIFTRDPNTGSKYFVLNWSDGSDTSAITSGIDGGKILVSHKNFLEEVEKFDIHAPFSEIVKISHKVSEIIGNDALDIEFAITDSEIYILQARNLRTNDNLLSDNSHTQLLSEINNKISDMQAPHPYLLGQTTIFGVMPDWNPAELIGIRPRELSLSLFKELISDNIWAYERDNLGYRNLRSFPLLVEFAGQPYIDCRVSMNSLIPKNISDDLGEKLVNFYLQKLSDRPELHDKIEFEIVFSSFTFDLDEKLKELESILSIEEINNLRIGIINLTKNIVNGNPYGIEDIRKKSELLSPKFREIRSSKLSNLSKIYWLIEDCKRYGTLPFAGAARCAFIATGILNSLVKIGIMSEADLIEFYSHIGNVTSEIMAEYSKLSREEFIDKYGHLRPGTFNILVPSYKENLDNYFPPDVNSFEREKKNSNFLKSLLHKIEDLRVENLLGITSTELINFCVESIKLREELKFEFSRNISEILNLVDRIGQDFNITKEDMSFVNIGIFIEAYRESIPLEDSIRLSIDSGKSREIQSLSTWLPQLIRYPREVGCFLVQNNEPNYITQKHVIGSPILIDIARDDLTNKIVFIIGADPGYDWIFAHGIAGIVTAYGGSNSHMSVRSKELDIPAAIGVGENIFNNLSKLDSVILDCRNKILRGAI